MKERMQQRIELGIERLVISGIAEADGLLIGAEIRRGLEEMLLRHGIPASLSQSAAVPYMDAGTYQAGTYQGQAGAAPESIGAGIARQIYQGWKK